MASPWIKFTVIFIVASALMVTGFSIAWYPHYRSEIIRLTLEQSSLTQAQRWEYEGSLSWWNNVGVFMFSSIGNSVLIGGLLVLLYAIVYIVTIVWRESKSPKKVETGSYPLFKNHFLRYLMIFVEASLAYYCW
jgi:hypothetical protein